MPNMMDDTDGLQTYVQEAVTQFADALGVGKDEEEKIREFLTRLENDGFFRIEPPQDEEGRILCLVVNQATGQMTSHKPGNILVNLRRDPAEMTGVFCSVFGAAGGLASQNPLFLFVSALGALTSASKLWKLEISKNGAAIVIALQRRGLRNHFSAPESECLRDANELLVQNGCAPMNDVTAQREIQTLRNYGCVSQEDGVVTLEEHVVGQF